MNDEDHRRLAELHLKPIAEAFGVAMDEHGLAEVASDPRLLSAFGRALIAAWSAGTKTGAAEALAQVEERTGVRAEIYFPDPPDDLSFAAR